MGAAKIALPRPAQAVDRQLRLPPRTAPRTDTAADHAPAAPGARMLTAGAVVRLAWASLVIGAMWLAVAWALA